MSNEIFMVLPFLEQITIQLKWLEPHLFQRQTHLTAFLETITNCLGGIEDIFYMESGEPVALRSGDVVLLASDGLWGPFTDRELVEAFFALPVAEVVDTLVGLALKREDGHSDNVTGVAVRWGNDEVAHNTAEPVSHVLEIS